MEGKSIRNGPICQDKDSELVCKSERVTYIWVQSSFFSFELCEKKKEIKPNLGFNKNILGAA